MEENPQFPETLQQVIEYLSDPDRALAYTVSIRWPDGIVCPRCGSKKEHSFLKSRRIWKCAGCRKQFSVKTGTIFEESPLGLNVWWSAVWMITNMKNGVSSCEIARAFGITQKSAWFVLHRIRLAMQAGSFEKKLCGIVEVDETYIGGKARNMHLSKKAEKKGKGRGTVGKIVVLGMLERNGRIETIVVPNIKASVLDKKVREFVESGSEVHTDDLASYRKLVDEYCHNVVDHAKEYVRGNVHTNSIENYWSLLKRSIKGTYTSCEPFHLHRYLDEQAFRFNNRQGSDRDRFVRVSKSVVGRRLTYKKLIGQDEPDVEQKKPRRGGKKKSG